MSFCFRQMCTGRAINYLVYVVVQAFFGQSQLMGINLNDFNSD